MYYVPLHNRYALSGVKCVSTLACRVLSVAGLDGSDWIYFEFWRIGGTGSHLKIMLCE